MMNTQMAAQSRSNAIKKPTRVSNKPCDMKVTNVDMKKRMISLKRMEELGLSTSKFDKNNDGHEDIDELEAMILINNGEPIPEDLEKRLRGKRDKEKSE